jgi:glycosyltransferase involved in cell wall biosynthesis
MIDIKRVVIVRRERGVSSSMDVYADNLVAEMKVIRPTWEIVEIAPKAWTKDVNQWHSGTGINKNIERLWRHPYAVSCLKGDIFHIIDHSNAHVAYWLKKKNCKVVITCHDLVQFIYPEILKDQARFPAFSLASWKYSVQGMKYADRVIAVSTNTAKDVASMLPIASEKIVIVLNGVEDKFYQLLADEAQEIKKSYESLPETFCLLNVGTNHQRKNIDNILKSLILLRSRGIPTKLWKVGSEFSPEQQKLIKLHNLEPMITFINTPDKITLLKLYNAADALLAPSLYEGFGLTILEAMACGTPVISANVSSLPEVAGDAAILVNPLDVQAIADAVCDLQSDAKMRQSYIEKGLARTKQFSWRSSTEQVAKVYESLINESVPTAEYQVVS